MSPGRFVGISVAVYFTMATATMGWIAADPCPLNPVAEKCGDAGDGWFAGLLGGLAWPAYWPYVVFKGIRQK